MNLRHLYTAVAILILNMLTLASSAQRNYPVRATVQYTPPYSLFLGDYATPKLIITLTGQDLLDANCPYKLSFSLECQNVKVTTKPSFNPAPLYINGGQTIVLTGADLARYFDIQNLDFHGITAAKYLQDGQLPEGFYRMNVKVIHYHENRVISNTAFTMFNARMGKPPVLTLPKDKSLIPPNQQVMPIVFSWTPKTVGSYQYRFELWECAVPGIPVQTVVSTIRPIYTQTTFSPMLTLHTANLNMKPGMEYAWRITVEDPHNQQKFANQGQSEIFTFTYKRKPEPVTGLRFSNRGLKITWTWNMDPAHTKYYFEYYDPQTGRTIDPVACDYAEFVRNMPQTGYHLKVRVKAECYGDPTLMSDYTPYLDTYLEPIPVPEYECGKVFPDREITNLELKHTFAPGEIVESKNGDTRYEIIFSEEKNGYLSGQFFMIMDCWGGAKIRCEFSKTQINTDNIVLKTIFHSVTDSTLYIKPETIRKEIQEAFFDAATVLTDFSIKDTVKIDKPYTYLYINESGKVMAVIDDKGKIKTEETNISATSLKENTLIQGKNGEELVLTKKGQVMGKDEFNATGGNSVLLKEYHRKSDSLAQWQINFSKYDAQTYAFDHIGSGNHGIFSSSDYYPQSGSYDFRYKSVECGKNDKVIVEFDTYREKDSVVFKDKYGVIYPIKDRILTFTGVNQADTNFIYAYRGEQKIGKLFLNTYQQKTYKVVFVRVNGAAKKLNAKEITKYLNKVYNQCAVSFEDSIDNITIDDLTSFSHGGSGILTVYNDDQKRVLQAYDKEMKDGVYYLFFIDNATDKKDGNGTLVSGYMPRGYNAGFIYDGGSLHTIAHELGHGIGNLEHVFESSSNSGKTKNLMDYSTGDELWHFQWDHIQDPSRVWMKWSKDEGEGEKIIRKLTGVYFNGIQRCSLDSLYFLEGVDDSVEIVAIDSSKSDTLNVKWTFSNASSPLSTKKLIVDKNTFRNDNFISLVGEKNKLIFVSDTVVTFYLFYHEKSFETIVCDTIKYYLSIHYNFDSIQKKLNDYILTNDYIPFLYSGLDSIYFKKDMYKYIDEVEETPVDEFDSLLISLYNSDKLVSDWTFDMLNEVRKLVNIDLKDDGENKLDEEFKTVLISKYKEKTKGTNSSNLNIISSTIYDILVEVLKDRLKNN